MNKCASIFILYLTTYITAFRIKNAQDSLDYDDIKSDIVEAIDYGKSRNIFTEEPMQDDFIDLEEKQLRRSKTIQKRDVKNDNKQYLYNIEGNNHSVYNQNGNNLEWYSCSTGLVVQLRRTGVNSTTNTNNSSGYNSIYNHFLRNLNNTNNPYNIKNNTIIKGFYGTYKVVRAYRPKTTHTKPLTNTNDIANKPKSSKMNDTSMNSLLNNNGNKNNITYNPDGIANNKTFNYSCSIMSSSNCAVGFKKSAGYCIPDLDDVESVDYHDYEFDFSDE